METLLIVLIAVAGALALLGLGFWSGWRVCAAKQQQLRELREASVQDATAKRIQELLAPFTGKLEEFQHRIKDGQEDSAKHLKAESKTLLEGTEKQISTVLKQIKERTDEFEKKVKDSQDVSNQRFTANANEQQEKIELLLKPFREKIFEFEKNVNQSLKTEVFSLKAQLEHFSKLSQSMQTQAENLTRALKGDVKMQGDWGEFVLEKVLEAAGFRAGEDYTKQESVDDEEGNRLRPDIIVKLPEDKNIIIDSKVSLVSYEKWFNTEEEAEKKAALNGLTISINNHITNLSSKGYHRTLNSPDFVIMFIPIEGVFTLALTSDPGIQTRALENRILLASPTLLFALIRVIALAWKTEKQNRNTQEIVRQAGRLYDKFCGFLQDMEILGKVLERSRDTYLAAANKLSRGKGNLVRQAEKMKQLGATAEKALPAAFAVDAEDELEAAEAATGEAAGISAGEEAEGPGPLLPAKQAALLGDE